MIKFNEELSAVNANMVSAIENSRTIDLKLREIERLLAEITDQIPYESFNNFLQKKCIARPFLSAAGSVSFCKRQLTTILTELIKTEKILDDISHVAVEKYSS
jgi:hypothetical protein